MLLTSQNINNCTSMVARAGDDGRDVVKNFIRQRVSPVEAAVLAPPRLVRRSYVADQITYLDTNFKSTLLNATIILLKLM